MKGRDPNGQDIGNSILGVFPPEFEIARNACRMQGAVPSVPKDVTQVVPTETTILNRHFDASTRDYPIDRGNAPYQFQLERCNDRVARLSNHKESMWGGLIRELAHNGCYVTYECRCCEAAGLFRSRTPAEPRNKKPRHIGVIEICYNQFPSDEAGFDFFFDNTVVHELIHANQDCGGFLADRDCLTVLKAEMEAYFCDNSCGQEGGNEAYSCLQSAISSACPSHCRDLSDWTILAATRWFNDRLATKTLCKFDPKKRSSL